jgi:hypothetical protein
MSVLADRGEEDLDLNRAFILGVSHDKDSTYTRGDSEAPLVDREVFSRAHPSWSETGIGFSALGRIVDHGDVQ